MRVRPRTGRKERRQTPHKRTSDIKRVKARHKHSKITPESIARMMSIGLDKAKQMLTATTQKGIQTTVHPIHRRYRVDHLDLHSQRLAGRWCVDWMLVRTKSLSQNTGAFVYSNGSMTEVFPMLNHSNVSAATSLKEFCEDVGIPRHLKSDRALEFCGRKSEFLKLAKKKSIELAYSEPEQKNQIHDIDTEIKELGRRTRNKMKLKNVPKRLWGFCYKHLAKIRQLIPRDKLQGRTAIETVMGKTPDISEYCDFDFYDLVWLGCILLLLVTVTAGVWSSNYCYWVINACHSITSFFAVTLWRAAVR